MLSRHSVLTFTAGIALAATAFAGEAGKAEKPAWPGNAQVVEARLAKPTPGADGSFSLPQFRVYDAQGRRLLDLEGYPHNFAAILSKLLAIGGKPDASHPLSSELALVVSPDGKAISSLPEAGLTFVKYWADWCVPCHAQSRDLVKVLGETPSVRVTVLNVEADLMKMGGAKKNDNP